jgi:transcriptional regulator with XRE-family HTH domain
MRSLRSSFGLRLKSIRTARKLTQEQFAEIIGVSVDFLSLIERGISAPSFERIEQIAKRLDTSVTLLFTFSPPRPEALWRRGNEGRNSMRVSKARPIRGNVFAVMQRGQVAYDEFRLP